MNKKLLIIAAIGLAFASCQKEEQVLPQAQTKQNWILIEQNVNLNGIICNAYKNDVTGQVVYEAKNNKAIKYTGKAGTSHSGTVTCSGSGTNCSNVKMDGESTILIKPGTQI